jgi:hypothetical protein
MASSAGSTLSILEFMREFYTEGDKIQTCERPL